VIEAGLERLLLGPLLAVADAELVGVRAHIWTVVTFTLWGMWFEAGARSPHWSMASLSAFNAVFAAGGMRRGGFAISAPEGVSSAAMTAQLVMAFPSMLVPTSMVSRRLVISLPSLPSFIHSTMTTTLPAVAAIAAAPQSSGHGLTVAIDFPFPSPPIQVRLLRHDLVLVAHCIAILWQFHRAR
jgi:hypothetical protein